MGDPKAKSKEHNTNCFGVMTKNNLTIKEYTASHRVKTKLLILICILSVMVAQLSPKQLVRVQVFEDMP